MMKSFLSIVLLLVTAFGSAQETWSEIKAKCLERKADSAYLLAVLKNTMGQPVPDANHIAEIGNYYMDGLKDPLIRSNIIVMGQLISYCQEKSLRAVDFFFKNAALIDKACAAKPGASWVDSTYAEFALSHIIYRKSIKPLLTGEKPFDWQKVRDILLSEYTMLSVQFIKYQDQGFEEYVSGELKIYINESTTPSHHDWIAMLNHFKEQFPGYDKLEPLVLDRKIKYYLSKKMWPECSAAICDYLQQYGAQLNPGSVNDRIWLIFLHSEDKKTIEKAIKWMEQLVLPVAPTGVHLDTYANLLYKAGRKPEAILWRKKSIEVQKKTVEEDKIEKAQQGRTASLHQLQLLQDYKTALERMQLDLPTWPRGEVD